MMNSWPMRSSSSVVTPGAMAAPTASMAPAAMRPASRIFAIVSGLLIYEAVTRSGPSWNMYSGRSMCSGTARIGETRPGFRVPRGAR